MADVKQQDLFINNEWVKPTSGKYTPIKSPATGAEVGQAAEGNPQDVEKSCGRRKSCV